MDCVLPIVYKLERTKVNESPFIHTNLLEKVNAIRISLDALLHYDSREADIESLVWIDNTAFYVFGKCDGYALLLSEEIDSMKVFGECCSWEKSEIRRYLNSDEPGDYLYDKPILKGLVSEKDIYTRRLGIESEIFSITRDKVFLLSEADLFGTMFGRITTRSEDYSLGEGYLLSAKARVNGDFYWLRSATPDSAYMQGVITSTGSLSSSAPILGCGVRPACWVAL